MSTRRHLRTCLASARRTSTRAAAASTQPAKAADNDFCAHRRAMISARRSTARVVAPSTRNSRHRRNAALATTVRILCTKRTRTSRSRYAPAIASRQSSKGIESESRRHRLATAAADRRRRLTSRAFSKSAVNADATVRFAMRRATRSILESLTFSALDASTASIQAAKAEAILTRRMRCTTLRNIVLFSLTSATHSTQSPNGDDSCSLRQRRMTLSSPCRRDLASAAFAAHASNAAAVNRVAIRRKNLSERETTRFCRLSSAQLSRQVANAAAVLTTRMRCTALMSFDRLR